MNLRQLEYFVTLAKLEHMTKAADLLNTTQPNLSHAMNELERELEIPLFEKKGRNIVLSKYGKFFLEYVERSLGELYKGEQALKDLVNPSFGHINFGCIYTMGPSVAPLIIREFNNQPENEKITFSLSMGTTEKVIQQLLNDEIDIALCSLKDNEERIDFIPVIEQELILITSLDHPLAKFDEVTLEQISSHPFINFTHGSGLRPTIDKLFKNIPLSNVVLEIDEDHAIAGFVQHKFGIAILPNIPTLSAFKIRKIPIKNIPFKRYIYLAKLKNKYTSPPIIKFNNFLTEYVKNENPII